MDESTSIDRAVLVAADINHQTWPSSSVEAESFLTAIHFVRADVQGTLQREGFIRGEIGGIEAGWSVHPKEGFGLTLILSQQSTDVARTASLARVAFSREFGSPDADSSDQNFIGAEWTTAAIHLALEVVGREPEGPFVLMTIHARRWSADNIGT